MADSMTIAEYKKQKPSKYRAVKTVVDGIRFASKREAKRYGELQLLQLSGQIAKLNRQVRFDLVVNGVSLGHYLADFSYIENDKFVCEDVKGWRDKSSPVYRLFTIKKRLVKALYDVEVRET